MWGPVPGLAALRRLIAEPRDPAHTSLREVMTCPVTTCRSQTSLEECVGVMTQEGIRHLPIVDDGNLRGIISSRDILAFQVEEQEATIRYLQSYTFDVGGGGRLGETFVPSGCAEFCGLIPD